MTPLTMDELGEIYRRTMVGRADVRPDLYEAIQDLVDREHPGMWDRSRDGLYVRVCKPWMLSTTCKYVRLWRPREWQHIDREHALEVIKKLGWE